MLFNSYPFLFVFLPAVLVVYAIAVRHGRRAATSTLLVASLVFYAGWDWHYLGLIGASALGNFAAGAALARRRSRVLLGVGIALNLALLGYYKYFNFFGTVLGDLGLPHWQATIVLPLGISFLTFHQIAYLVECHRGRVIRHGFADYALYITFFPHLIAGPIVRPGDLLVRIVHHGRHFDARRLAIGLSFLSVGLAKKVLIADSLAGYVDPFYAWVGNGGHPSFLEAWGAALAYSFQLYFDFSGYSDMAVGLGLMVGLRLPVNFFSPYKAASLIEFWRRWHVTLSRFLRDYLYIPLGGSRHGKVRHFAALLATMALCGQWHGAGYTYLVWGGLHGCLLVGNHLWRSAIAFAGPPGRFRLLAGWTTTFLTVTCLWVVFRAPSLPIAGKVLAAMAGADGVALPLTYQDRLAGLSRFGIHFDQVDYFYGLPQMAALALLTVAVTTLPNAYQWLLPTFARADMRLGGDVSGWWPRWKPSAPVACVLAGATALSLLLLVRPSTFLYFQF
jgi:D-alanyl-lipoteichoic acid acyltransferase DltB (MBOAT superfamily)